MDENVVQINPPIEDEKPPYTLRKLCARDVFPFMKIMSKIGIKQFSDCFNVETDENGDVSFGIADAGIAVAFSIADVLMSNLYKCEDEIYTFLAGLSGMEKEEIMDLELGVFAQMIIDVFQKKEFSDFFKVVSRLLDTDN